MVQFEPIEIDLSEAMIMGTIPCGPGEIPLDEGVWTRLQDEISRHPESTRFLKAKGTSMLGYRIYPGDIVIYDEAEEAQSGDLVVAYIAGEGYTVKELKGRDLISDNGLEKKRIRLRGETKIIGVMIGEIRRRRRR